MEDFGSRDSNPDEFCRRQAAACDVFVGVVGHLYGSSPSGFDESFTEREYNAASKAGRPLLMFVASDDSSLPASCQESDEKRLKQQAFRSRVSAERIRHSFRSPDDLASAVVIALRNWEQGSTAAKPEMAGVTPAIAPEKIISGLNTQSFFAMESYFRATDYIRLIAAPLPPNARRLDQDAQRSFQGLVEAAFPEIRGFDQDIPRGAFYNIQSYTQSRSSSHRVWCLWNSGAVGYTANLDHSSALPIGDLVLHYIFFWRLTESVLGPSAKVVLEAELACPNSRFTPHFPDPHGGRTDYDLVAGVRFDEHHPHAREQIRKIEEFQLPDEDIAQKLAELILFQVQETAAARIDFERWGEAITNLIRQTSFRNWGKLR